MDSSSPKTAEPTNATDKPLGFATPVQYMKGCGPQRAELLAKLGIRTAQDLLFHFPRDHQDLTDLKTIDQLKEGELSSVLGTVAETDIRELRTGRTMVGVLLRQGDGFLRGVWFNQAFMFDKFRTGQRLLFSGTTKLNGGRWEMAHPRVRWLEDDEEMPAGEMLPVYSLTEGVTQYHLRKLTRLAVDELASQLEDVFPDTFLQQHRLLPIGAAIAQVHFPRSQAELEAARRRLVYQELFVLQLALAVRRQQNVVGLAAKPFTATAQIDARIRRLFPYELTNGQNSAIAEISNDMDRPQPMNRLLQGEVGSGKTAVAAYAMLLTIAHGSQAALMAPTEILAQQHYQSLGKLLAKSRVKIGLLTGKMPAADRAELLSGIADGTIQLVIGTQAILQDDIAFADLGLVVIDEQHKFGVRQRAFLRQTGTAPHYLVMTATPIPRSVAMTLYGDLELTTLRELPPGRQEVKTYLAGEQQTEKWWHFVARKLREGRQAYVVAPLVEVSSEMTVASVDETFEALANGPLEAFRLGILHGRMSPEEKATAMDKFRRGETQVLCATSVVEVGVDVPNATLMTVLDAERFGLAQLHQLRGRIGRGAHPGYCCLMSNATPETNAEAVERLTAFCETTDGFALAELDFKLRGPGDLFGIKQHGLPPLMVADLQRDRVLLEQARADARKFVHDDPGLAQPEHGLLRKRVLGKYGQSLGLADVG